MFLHHFLLLLATLPSFIPLASALKNRHLDRRPHARAHSPPVLPRQAASDKTACIPAEPADTVTERLNSALSSGGAGFVLSLCPSTQYLITAPIVFTAPNQEISTQGYPTDGSRATLVVSGPAQTHTTAVVGTDGNCNGVKLRNIQINGNRGGASITGGGANIEMGGANSNQLIEYVHSYDTRSWSCLHVAEGGFNCNNVVVQNNDVGPCGNGGFFQWADGISVSCRNAQVRNNVVTDHSDGGIVLFGSPGTIVEKNIVQVQRNIALGGINMVDVLPWLGDFTGVVVQNNIILGGFATDGKEATQKEGDNQYNAMIKIGIAIGPRTWFNTYFGDNVTYSATVKNNHYSGAFGYAMAITSARDFTVQGNTLFGNTSFIGSRGPNCSATDPTPASAPFLIEPSTVTDSNIQSDFVSVPDANLLTCVVPPSGGDYWPYGGDSASISELVSGVSALPANVSPRANSSTSSSVPIHSSTPGPNSAGHSSSTSSPGPIHSSSSHYFGPGPKKHNSSSSCKRHTKS